MTDTITLPREDVKRMLDSVYTGTQHISCATGPEAHARDCLIDSLIVLRAALAQQASQVAQQAEQGWVRVPVEPTAEMINAYASVPYDEGSIASECRSGWRAMLAAAPKGGV